jgi:hypothetical protein
MRLLALTLVVVGGAAGSSLALADGPVLPDSPDLPWADPNHQSPTEVLASQVASGLAGRSVRVYCNGQTDWNTLAASVGFDGTYIWGYVLRPRYWYPSLGTWAESAPDTKLAPIACDHLWRYGKAARKPTMCDASRAQSTSRQVTVRYRATVKSKVRKRVKVNGVYKWKTVTVVKKVWKTRVETRTDTTTVPIDPIPCYATLTDTSITRADPTDGKQSYHDYVLALQTISHESIHLYDDTEGRHVYAKPEPEQRADCLGMQHLADTARAFGATAEDAASIAQYYANELYPLRRTQAPDYWSSDCRSDGPLDQSPGDGRWP